MRYGGDESGEASGVSAQERASFTSVSPSPELSWS